MPNLNPRRSGEPRTASLIPATDVRSRMRAATNSGERWQRQVIKYDREGPGILGYYLDTVALLASLCPLVPQVKQRDGSWVDSDDPVLATALAGYSSDLMSQQELVATHVRHREGLGEAWIVYSDELGWLVVTVPNLTVNGTGDVDLTDAYGLKRRVPKNRVWKSWVPDPYEPWLPTSPVRRALPELRRLHAAVRNQTRSAESRLTTNGLLAFPPDADGNRPLRSTAAGGPSPTGVDKIVDDYVALAQDAFKDDDSPAAWTPYPYVGAPAVHVDIGRSIDAGAMEVETKALEAFARAVNFPAQLLMSGPGAANHWNEWVLQEVQHRMGLAPKLQPVCEDITKFYLRPVVGQIRSRVGSWDIRPDNVRVSYDMSFLAQKPDLTAQAMEAYRLGLATREEVAEALGIKRMLEIPKGLSEYEHWELATGSKGAPYAEVDADGRLIVPDMGGGMGFPPPGEPLPPEPAPAEPAPADQPVADPLTTTDTQSPPEPPAALAAVGTDSTATATRLSDKLSRIDQRLEAELLGIHAAAQTAVVAAMAKEAIRLMPSQSPERAQLRDLPADEVWAQVPLEIRAQVDVNGVAEREAARFEAQAAAALEAAAQEAEEEWQGTGWGVPTFLVAAGATAFTAAIAGEAIGVFAKLAATPAVLADESFDAVKKLALVRGRTYVARTAMTAAAGATMSMTNEVRRTQAGTPEPAEDGGPWQGGTGMALGHSSAKLLDDAGRRNGFRLAYRWEHGFFGKPDTPYPPHLALDGQRFDSLADVPGGFFPGDHKWCRCAFLWDPERTE